MQNGAKTADDQGFRGLLRSRRRWFFQWTAAAFALRLLFLLRFPYLTPDGSVYGDLAKNWLLRHVYGLSGPGGPEPTYIRLPGYPAFLAGVWAVFGVEHYNAARFAQVFIDVGTCFIIADLARRTTAGSGHLSSRQAATWAFALAALCPFLANYTAVPLTETLAIFFAAIALDLAVAARTSQPDSSAVAIGAWAGCGLAMAAGIYLRPDGGIVLIAIGGFLLLRLAWNRQRRETMVAGVVVALCSLLSLVPWTARNWRVFHQFMPLAPTHANAPGEYYPAGFDRWMRTWLADYASLEDVGFKMDGTEIDVATLPDRAFDNAGERNATQELLDRYNQTVTMTPELDAQFDRLAAQRIQRRPLRYYVVLPMVRMLDLWLRPRTEMLPLDTHWWRFRDDPHDFAWAALLGAINGVYIVMALAGAVGAWREIRYAGLLAGFVVLRTVILTALVFPEPRYVLECYPVVIVFAVFSLQSSVFSRGSSSEPRTG
jgi:dolichyl-phosphate-mannose-protein mannosyltransferase